MKNILSKILKSKKNLNEINYKFQEIQNSTKVNQLFEAISNHNDSSEIRYVGGCIRKILNYENVDDIDLATNIKPNEVIECLKKNNISYFETGINHGTITANIDSKNFEITSLRKDIATDGRHAKVEYSKDWREDASRRDFTINSMYSDLQGNIFDPYDGKADLKLGKLNFIGDPEKRIQEDYLRILRYVRFFLNYSKKEHEPNVKKIIRQNINGISNISNDRLIDELKKLVLSKGFLKINDDKFCCEIILLIFPQLKNISIFKNLNKYALESYFQQKFIFLLSLMIIDETDNTEYFLYKFNISNEDKKKIMFLKKIYSNPIDKNTFSEKNLWKIYYFNNKNYLIDMLNFNIFKKKKVDDKLIKIKDFFVGKEKPVFPITGKDLMQKYNLKEGRELGTILKNIEDVWIENNFKVSQKDIDKLVKS